jgi:hypothetical protein
MELIKKFRDFFSKKRELDEADIEDIKDIFDELFDEMSSRYSLEKNKDLFLDVSLYDKNEIRGSLKVNPDIERLYNGRMARGRLVIKDTFLFVINDPNFKEVKDHLKARYEFTDDLDKVYDKDDYLQKDDFEWQGMYYFKIKAKA